MENGALHNPRMFTLWEMETRGPVSSRRRHFYFNHAKRVFSGMKYAALTVEEEDPLEEGKTNIMRLMVQWKYSTT